MKSVESSKANALAEIVPSTLLVGRRRARSSPEVDTKAILLPAEPVFQSSLWTRFELSVCRLFKLNFESKSDKKIG